MAHTPIPCNLCDGKAIYSGPDPDNHSKRLSVCGDCISENDGILRFEISEDAKQNKKDDLLLVRMPKALKKKLQVLAARKGLDMSTYVRMLIAEKLAKKK